MVVAALVVAVVVVLVTALLAVRVIDAVREQSRLNSVLLAESITAITEAQTAAITRAAESVGKAFQTAQTPVAPPGPSIEELTTVVSNAMHKYEDAADFSDPTDGASWLTPPRPAVQMVSADDPEPFGIPGLVPLWKQPPETAASDA